MYTINDLTNQVIPTNAVYYNDYWYLDMVLYANIQPEISNPFVKLLKYKFGKRELQIPDELIVDNYDKIKNGTFVNDVLIPYIKDSIDLLFINNRMKYVKLYDVLNREEYNPLWNVDGTETLTYTRTNEGTQSNESTNTGTVGIAKTNTGTVNQSTTNTGTQRNEVTNTGTVRTQKDDSGTVTDSGSVNFTDNNGVATDNTETYYNSEKKTHSETNGNTRTNDLTEDTTQTNNLSENATRTDNLSQQDLITNNLSENTTQTNNLNNENVRTDNLTEEYTERRVRTGNIGVTKSQDLLESEVKIRTMYNFTDILLSDVANWISYGVY